MQQAVPRRCPPARKKIKRKIHASCGLQNLLTLSIQYNTKFVKRHVAVASEALLAANV